MSFLGINTEILRYAQNDNGVICLIMECFREHFL